MALENLVYNLPKSGGLSTLHALSRQKKAASNRFGRTPTGVSTFHGIGDFAAAPIQNQMSGGGGEQPAPPAVPAPVVPGAVSSFAPVSGANPGEIGGFTVGKGMQGLMDMMGEQIGNTMAKGVLGRGVNKGLQTSLAATAMNAPLDATLDASLDSAVLGMMGIPGLAKGGLDALAASHSASQIGEAIGQRGVLGPNTAVSGEDAPPMGTAMANVALSSLSNSPNTALDAVMGMFGNDPSAGDVANASLDAAMLGLSQSPNVSKGSQDPVAQSLLNLNPKVLQNMMSQNLSEEAVDTPTSLDSMDMQGFSPMSLGFSDTPNPAEGGFTPMGLGGSTPSSPDMGGFSPMGLGPAGTAPGGAGAGAGGSLGPAGTPGATGMGGPVGGDGGDGGGDGTVICTELHRQGLMPEEIYKADSEYGKSLDDDTMRGYLSWGIPVAGAMGKSPILTAIVKPFALNWAYHMAGEHNSFGKIALAVGIPICRWLGTRQVSQREWSI